MKTQLTNERTRQMSRVWQSGHRATGYVYAEGHDAVPHLRERVVFVHRAGVSEVREQQYEAEDDGVGPASDAEDGLLRVRI